MNGVPSAAVVRGAADLCVSVAGTEFHLLRVPAGRFDLGSLLLEPGHQPNEAPVRRVTLTKPFHLGKTPVTRGQYRAVMGSVPGPPAADDVAVTELRYADAVEFCACLTRLASVAVTLPTEAQWEYACRAGTTTPFSSGSGRAALDRVGWFRDNAGARAHEVGQKGPNAWGFHDLHGNVWEPCRDLLPDYDSIPDVDPVGRVSRYQGAMRGGGWMHPCEDCRAACRFLTDDAFGGLGIRLCIESMA
jgi:formylglycine-generating enzyme required for sulfatase activity